jgi:hypothetical protein
MDLTVNHTISFRRPELSYVLSKMSVPSEGDVAMHVRRLEDLGYKIINVSPPLESYGPPQNPKLLQLLAVGRAAASSQSNMQR